MTSKIKDNNHREELLNLGPEIEKCRAKGFSLLVFPLIIEQIFLADTLESRRKRFFILGIIAIAMYNLFLFTDREMLPDIYLTAWKIRLGIFTPLMIICLLLMRLPAFARFLDFITDFLLLLASASIIVMLELSRHPNVVHYHTGIILIVMFGNIVVRLRFWHAFGVSLLTFLLYVLAVSRIEMMPPPVAINSSVVLLSAIIISLLANYQMENDQRANYLRELLTEIETIRLKETKAQLEQLSSSDDLTGLANRRHFDACLDAEWKMAVNYRSPLSLLFLDVDDFKPYNDHYGHQAGDVCLRKIAAVLRQTIRRPQDICARYGGEEFVVLLPNTFQENAAQLAENIRKGVEREKIPHIHSRAASYVTVSIGIASMMPRPGLDQNILIEMTDKALYKAKEMGRNRVQVFDHTE